MHICISIICEFSNTQVNLFSPGNYNFFKIKKPELTKNRTIHYIHKRKGEGVNVAIKYRGMDIKTRFLSC
jgi:hypothetical protein